MSIFGNSNRNPFGTLSGVIYENRDTLIYAGVVAISIGEFIQYGHVSPYFAYAPLVREGIRTFGWLLRSMRSESKLCLAEGQKETINAEKFAYAASIGTVTAASMGTFEFALNHASFQSASIGVPIVMSAGAVITYLNLRQFSGGMREVLECYKKMWNYTDDDGTGGHTQRLIKSLKGALEKASDWIGDHIPQPIQPISAPIPVQRRVFLSS
ncbi:MAG: hypothetical protein SFW62_08500 [Alphaproteobacteria bacterium]|nr:hypothetical protein [Alphaproteobacteria bacterium]